MPLFLLIPAMLRGGYGFWPTLGIGIVMTLGLYAVAFWAAPRIGIAL
jgi:hypothetical protein